MKTLTTKIRNNLKENIDKKTQNNFHRFFKEEVKCHGVKTAVVRKIADFFWREVKYFKKREIFELCEELFSSDYCEEAFVVSFWLPKMTDQFEPGDCIGQILGRTAVNQGAVNEYLIGIRNRVQFKIDMSQSTPISRNSGSGIIEHIACIEFNNTVLYIGDTAIVPRKIEF